MTGMDSLTVLESRSLKPRPWRGHALSASSWEGSFLASSSFQWLWAILGVPWLVAASLQSPPPSSHGLAWVFCYVSVDKALVPFSYKNASHWIRGHPHKYNDILT